ncbi:hypothetical protein AAHE18_19G201500 [Arachis hypogaea]
MEIQLLAFMFLTIAILNDAKVPSRYSFQGPGAQAVFNCVVEIGKGIKVRCELHKTSGLLKCSDNEGDIGFRRGDARHYTLYTGILGNILSSWITCSKRMQVSRVYNSYVKRPCINKRDFLAQVPAFQYQYPVIIDVNI